VITTYLKRKGKPLVYTLVPAAVMFVITGWAMASKTVEFAGANAERIHLLVISVVVIALELWMVAETVKVLVEGPRDGGGSAGRPADQARPESGA
jgi:hypothetical protein